MSTGSEPVPVAPPVFGAAGDDDEAPTQQIGLAAVGDRCVNCGALLSSDQRYCVNCGERRGQARFALAETATEAAPVASAPPRAPRRPRASAGFTLIAGVATLLIALGVGVLIGHNGQTSARTPTQNITVAGGSAAAPAATTATTATTGSAGNTATRSKPKRKSSGQKAKAAAKSAPSAKTSAKAAVAASKVTGGSAKVAAPTVTSGSSCTAGSAGCQGGKFTGGFFGN
jgi:hypothetical protein